MSTVSPQLDAIIRQVGGPASPSYRNLRSAIESSPVLQQQMEAAVARGDLKHFAFMPQNEHAGASYNPQTQTINLKQLNLADPNQQHLLTFLIGHELQHGLNRQQTAAQKQQFVQQATQVLQSGQQVHNYAPVFRQMLAVNRRDEASSHIAGWNAFVSRVKHDNPQATLAQVVGIAGEKGVGYVADFIQAKQVDGQIQFSAKPGFTLNTDLSITANAQNIEAAGKHYFDKTPTQARIGARGNSDYSNFYAADLVSYVCQLESLNPSLAGKLTLDMRGEGLKESLLEQDGISLGNNPPPGTRCTYYDTRSPDTARHFDHTISTHRYVPIQSLPEPTVLTKDDPALTQPSRRELSAQERQWDQTMEKLITPKLEGQGYSAEQIENIKAASMVAMAKHYPDRDMAFVGINQERGMVVMAQEGKGYFVPTVTLESVKDIPAQQSLEQLDQQLVQQPQQALNPAHEHSGPSLSR